MADTKDLLTATVLVLAHQLKILKKLHGITSTSDFMDDAIRLIRDKKPQVLRAFPGIYDS